MSKEFVFGVIGAGNGGKAMAAYLALLGKKVLLYNRTFSHVEVIAERGGIDLLSPWWVGRLWQAGNGNRKYWRISGKFTGDHGCHTFNRPQGYCPGRPRLTCAMTTSSSCTSAEPAARWSLRRRFARTAVQPIRSSLKPKLSFLPAGPRDQAWHEFSASKNPFRWRRCPQTAPEKPWTQSGPLFRSTSMEETS